MRRLLLLLLCTATFAAASDPYNKIVELKLTDGRILKNVQIVSFASTAVMAKWEGGRGTIAYDSFPSEMRKELEKRRPNQQENATTTTRPTPPRPRPPPPGKNTGSKLDYIQTTGFDVRAFDRGQTIAHVAWKVTLTNISSETMRVRPLVTFNDAKGFKLNEERGDAVTLGPGASRNFAENTILSLRVWEQAKTFGLTLVLLD